MLNVSWLTLSWWTRLTQVASGRVCMANVSSTWKFKPQIYFIMRNLCNTSMNRSESFDGKICKSYKRSITFSFKKFQVSNSQGIEDLRKWLFTYRISYFDICNHTRWQTFSLHIGNGKVVSHVTQVIYYSIKFWLTLPHATLIIWTGLVL